MCTSSRLISAVFGEISMTTAKWVDPECGVEIPDVSIVMIIFKIKQSDKSETRSQASE